MEDYYDNNSSMLNDSYEEDNSTDVDVYGPSVGFSYVFTCIIISVGLPLTLVAIYAVYSLVQKDHVAPIYVINLLISDLIQFCCMISEVVEYLHDFISYMYQIGLMASVSFMVCIAMERYLVIAWPLWYRHRRTVKVSVGVCVAVWTVPVAYILFTYFCKDDKHIFFAVFILLPFPLLVFFLGGAVKALSAAISVSSEEKLRIMGLLVLVLLIYTLLFLPTAILSLTPDSKYSHDFIEVSFLLLKLSPLADLFMYVFLRKGAVNKLRAFVCCRGGSSDSSRFTVNDENTVSSMKMESEKF